MKEHRNDLDSQSHRRSNDRIDPIFPRGFVHRSATGGQVNATPNDVYLSLRNIEPTGSDQLWQMIHLGSMPQLVASDNDWEAFYSSYVSTYIDRDVNQLSNIANKGDFIAFMVAVAARSGELLNYDSLARDCAVSSSTTRRWMQILETSGLILLVQPYSNNHLKRIIKTPKIYFHDTGLMAYLTRWITPETIQNGAKAGQFFETWVVSEIAKSFLNAGKSMRDIYFIGTPIREKSSWCWRSDVHSTRSRLR